MPGVTASGFVRKTLPEIVTELENALKAELGDSIDVGPEGPFGQIIGVMAERYSDLWELGEEVYTGATPDGATGVSQDNVCSITGTVREAARASTVTLAATGTAGTVLASGRIVSVVTVGTRFLTTAVATIAAAAAWAGTTGYVVGNRVKNNSRIYECASPGTSAGSGGPTGTATGIPDGTCSWNYLGEGVGVIDVEAEAEETGPSNGSARTITVIETPVAGWSSVINPLDAELGANIEPDPALRLRREDEIRASGNAALEAVRAALLQVDGVTAATVFENVTDTTDGDGVPPHAIECLVRGGDDAEIAAAVFASVAAGIATHGTDTEVVTDSQGIDHTIKFSRPTEKLVYVTLTLIVSSDYPVDGDALVKLAVVAYGDLQASGKNVVASVLAAQAFEVTGVLDASALISIAPTTVPVASTTIAISLRQLAVYDTSRISISKSTEVP